MPTRKPNDRIIFPAYTTDLYSLISLLQGLNEGTDASILDEEDIFLYLSTELSIVNLLYGVRFLDEEKLAILSIGTRSLDKKVKFAIFDLNQGKAITKYEFDDVDEYKSGVLSVYKKDKGWGLLNSKGKYLVECSKQYSTKINKEFMKLRKKITEDLNS